MKKTLRTLILTIGVLATTGISSAVYAQDCNTTNYKVVNAQDAKTINCTVKAGDSLKDMCAKYGVVVPKGLEAKPQVTNTCKATATKVAPAKTTPSKATPAPVKTAPTKATPAPAAAPVKPAPTKTPATTNLTENNKLEKEVVTLVNQERAKQGLAPLKDNSQLSNVARTKSEDMVSNNYFSHTSPTYGSPFDMMKKFGITYNAAGENIAMGQQTAASVMNGWMNSPGHKANILSANFTEIGVGVAKDKSGTIYWTQEFIGK